MRPKVIAHRGARKSAPENTLEAFKLAIDAGAEGIELDVHRCLTGEIVVIHDETVNRTTDSVGYVSEISWAELQRLDAGSWFDAKYAGAKIPSLKQVLELISGSIVLNIEVKNAPIQYPGIEEDILDVLEGYPKETVIISSFDHGVLKRFSELDPAINLAVLADAIFYDLQSYAANFGAKYWHPGFGELRDDAVKAAHSAGLQVNSWTLNTPKDWKRGIDMKLDGIVTDDPKGLLDVFGRIASAAEA